VKPWDASISTNPPSVTYESTSHPSGILSWLDKVHTHGFCFVSGVPATPEATEELIRRISHIRETHCEPLSPVTLLTQDGGFWDFTSNMSHGDLAYSAEGLPAHTDTTYFTDPAGLQIFHMLSHPPPGQGGKSLLVDGFYAVSKLSPSSYKTLSTLLVPTHASGTKGTMLKPLPRPVLNHHNGRLTQVRWNNEDRGVLRWSREEMREWYVAAREFEGILRSKEVEYWVQLEPGTVVGECAWVDEG
jgi:trimethyllysine dioxygenase